jgi:hypothetical protein
MIATASAHTSQGTRSGRGSRMTTAVTRDLRAALASV